MEETENLIMLSYARCGEDEDVCVKIREALIESGFSVFMDLIGIDKKYLAETLDAACCFIACLSPSYVTDADCESEKGMAVELDKRGKLFYQTIFVKPYDISKDSHNRLIINRNYYVDFSKMEFGEAVNELLRLLKQNNIVCNGQWLDFNKTVQSGFAEKKTDVMISYTWDPDQQVCMQIRNQLTQSGYCVWTDVGNMANDMDRAISHAIFNTCCFIACISPTYAKKYECKREKNMAIDLWGQEKRLMLVPIIVGEDSSFNMTAFFKESKLCLGKVIPINIVRCGLKIGLRKLMNVLELYQIPRTGRGRSEGACGETCTATFANISETSVKVEQQQMKGSEEHEEVSSRKEATLAVSEKYTYERVLSSKMSKVVISKVITVAKNWPSFDVPKASVSGIAVLSNGDVVVLDKEKSSIRIFQLNSNGKYSKKCECIKGFVTKPISVCTYKLISSNEERIAVLERTEKTGTKLFTCSNSLADKQCCGNLVETSFVVRFNYSQQLFYIGMCGGNVVVVDPKKCLNKQSSDDIPFEQTLSFPEVRSVSILALDRSGSVLCVADNCASCVFVYYLKTSQITATLQLKTSPNDVLIDSGDNILILARGNHFEAHSVFRGADLSCQLTRSEKVAGVPDENYFARHLQFMESQNSALPVLLICTGHGKTAKIDYASVSQC